jgi:hypothetical protein
VEKALRFFVLSLSTVTNATIEAIDRLEAELPIDGDTPDASVRAVRGATSVTVEALELAASIVAERPDRFGDFDGLMIAETVFYERLMGKIATRAEAFAASLRKSIAKRHHRAASQATALHATIRALSRHVPDPELHAHGEALGDALWPVRRKPRTGTTRTTRTTKGKGA